MSAKPRQDLSRKNTKRLSHRLTPSIILCLFIFSGATGLIYEVVWTRMFGLVFGNTVYAVSTVLAVFMGGLALGSYYLGRLADRQKNLLQFYASLEAGVGLFAVLVPLLIHAANALYSQIYAFAPHNLFMFTVVRLLVATLILFGPTFLMGGTLPVLSQYFIRTDGQTGRSVGNLYAANTLGAVLGTFAAGFFLIEKLGVRETIYAAAGINFLIAFVIFWLQAAAHQESRSPAKQATKKTPLSARQKWVLWGMFFSGLAALAYEVLWNRLLVFLLTASTYAFSIMLLSFLIGIALGSYVMAKIVDRLAHPLFWFAALEFAIGLFGFFSIYLLSRSVQVFDWAVAAVRVLLWWRWNLVQLAVALVVMLIPTTLMGATFPLAVRLFVGNTDKIGEKVGRIYSLNTVGGVLGSLGAGFFLIPVFGTQNSLILVAALNFGVAFWFWFRTPETRFTGKWLAATAVTALYVAALFWIPKNLFLTVYNVSHRNSRIIYYDEGVTSTVTVHQYSGGNRSIYTNNVQVAGTDFDMRTTQELQGHIPLLLHSHPQRVMQVGFGTGETGHIVSLYPVQAIDGIEISPEVIRAGIYFQTLNHGIFNNPIFHKVLMDGRNYAMLTRKTYDIIMNDSIHPNVSNNASLYTVDYFRYCRSKLAPDGIMSSWFPLFGLPLRDFKIIIKSFQTVFPHCSVWIANNCVNRHALLVGWKKDAPLQIDFALLKQKVQNPVIHASLAQIHMDDVYSILDAFVLDEAAVRKFTQDVPVHSDDHPILEFDAPRVEGSDEAVLARNLESTLAYRVPVTPHLVHIEQSGENPDSVKATLGRFYRASTYVWQGLLHALREEHLQARLAYWHALQINPQDKDAPYLIRYDREQEKVLAEHLHLNPADWENQVRLGLSLLGEGKLAEAEKHFRRALALHPKSAEAHANLGLVFLYRKNWDAAIAELKKALRLDPTLTEAQYNLGFAYLGKNGSYPEAASAWEKAVRIDPLYTSAHFNLGLALWKLNRIPAAVAQFRIVISQNPSDAEAQKYLGKLLLLDGKPAEARSHLQKYLQMKPKARDRQSIEKLLGAIG